MRHIPMIALCILGLSAGVLAAYLTFTIGKANTLKYTDAKEQIEKIEQVRSNIISMVLFFERQERKIARSEKVLRELIAKNDELKPIVTADKEQIEAILLAHSISQRQNVLVDRVIGFLIGICGSIIAAFIWRWLSAKAFMRNGNV